MKERKKKRGGEHGAGIVKSGERLGFVRYHEVTKVREARKKEKGKKKS